MRAGERPAGVEAQPCSCARSGPLPAGSRKPGRKPPRGRSCHLPAALEQRHLDLIGLLLIAAGVYLSFVLFFGWDGGKVGYGLETALVYLVGEVGARIFDGSDAAGRGAAGHRHLDLDPLPRHRSRPADALPRQSRCRPDGDPERGATGARRADAFAFETQAGATDVMSGYPEDDDVEPTVALAEEPER